MDQRTAVKWNPFSIGYFDDPYPHFKDCRLNNPIQEIFPQSYFFFKYEDTYKILRQNEFSVHSISDYLFEKEDYIFKNIENACPFLGESTKMWPMYLNGDIHRRVRSAITKAFHAFPINQYIFDSIAEINLSFKEEKSFDLVHYCGEYIFSITKKIFEISGNIKFEELDKLSNLVAKSQDLYIPKQVYQKINEEILRHKNLFNKSKFAEIIYAETRDLGLKENEIFSILLVSFMASYETSKNSMIMSLYEILKERALIDYVLVANNERLRLLNEELLRYNSPLNFTIRINNVPLEMGNYLIKEQSKLYLCIGSANRDENQFENADSIIPDRIGNKHLAFGAGSHICLGSVIARNEMEQGIKPMIEFLKDFAPLNTIWSKQIFMRTVESIRLKKI